MEFSLVYKSVVGCPAGDGGAAGGDAKQHGHVEHTRTIQLKKCGSIFSIF
jgi:hypothetical protein